MSVSIKERIDKISLNDKYRKEKYKEIKTIEVIKFICPKCYHRISTEFNENILTKEKRIVCGYCGENLSEDKYVLSKTKEIKEIVADTETR